jgi:hypothetical protein
MPRGPKGEKRPADAIGMECRSVLFASFAMSRICFHLTFALGGYRIHLNQLYHLNPLGSLGRADKKQMFKEQIRQCGMNSRHVARLAIHREPDAPLRLKVIGVTYSSEGKGRAAKSFLMKTA